jgi:hypothetical protein
MVFRTLHELGHDEKAVQLIDSEPSSLLCLFAVTLY